MKNISIHKNTFTRAALTLLVVLAITLTASATDFITDVMVAGHSDQTQFNTLIQNLQQEGWTDINYDLNKGCGSSSYYIHLLYKTQSSSGNTVTLYAKWHVPTPTGLTCTNITNTTATLTWTSEAASWQIMLNNDEQNLIDANAKPFTLTGLTPQTSYTVKVRGISDNTYSDWSDSQSFTTTNNNAIPGQQALPYAYSFENNNLSADGWRLQGASRNCTGIHNALAHTGSYLLRISFSENGVYLVSPIFTGGDDGIYMSFYYTEYDNMYGSEKFQVGYTTDETVTNPSNFTYGEVVTASTQWQKYSQIFPAGTKRIAIKYIYTRSWYLFLDDFLFKVPGEVSSFDLPIAAYTDNGGYHLITSPIADPIRPNAENGFITTGTFDLYRFNQAANLEWENWKQTGDHYHFNLESGRGYLYANQAGTTLTFSGTPYAGNGEVTLNYSTDNPNENMRGWNLIGNPFNTAATLSNKPFYRMNTLGTEIIAAENNTVEAMEGIFVIAETDGETVTFTAPQRSPQRGDDGEASIVLNLSQNDGAVIDRAIVRFGEGQTLPKFQIHKNSTKIYIPKDGKDYAVVSVGRDAMHCLPAEIPIHFKATENGVYTLTVSESLNSKFLILNLIDNLTGADVDLLASNDGDATHCVSTAYTFTAKTTDYANRFKLVFSTIENDNESDNDNFAFISNGEIVITGIEDACDASIQVIDRLGHVLVCRDAPRASNISTAGMTPGVYVLRLINGNEIKTQKIVVR